MRYALLQESDGLVTNLIELDEPSTYDPGEGNDLLLIEGVPGLEYTNVGDTIVDGVLYPAPPPPAPIYHRGVQVAESERATVLAATSGSLPLIVTCEGVDLKLYVDDETELAELQAAATL